MIIGYDNNLGRWAARAEHYQQKNDWTAALPAKKGKDPATDTKIMDPIHDAKYSASDTGHSPFGSWTDEGVKNFKAYMKEIMAKRADEKVMAEMIKFETDFLKYLQDKHKVDAGKKKGKKRKAGSDQAVVVPQKESSGEDLDEDIFG